MICPYCLMYIEDDSAYCDQCGEELFICPVCGQLGKEKYCETDNVKFVSVRGEKKFTTKNFFRTERVKSSKRYIFENKELIIKNKNLELELRLKHNDIIGRNNKKFSQLLAKYKQISGNHAKVTYTSGIGWSISDLDSLNGTKYNGEKLESFKEVKLEEGTFITLANIEFYVMMKTG